MDVAGTFIATSRLGIKNLEDIIFADQFSGATVTQQIDAAIAFASSGQLVVIPSTMGAGSATSYGAGACVLDLRSASGSNFALWNGSTSLPALRVTANGVISAAFTSATTNTALGGAIRLANSDGIFFRRASGALSVQAVSMNGNAVVIGSTGFGASVSGALAITGALSGVTDISYSGQLTSSVAIGTAPLVITSTTVVPNLNVATLNGVTVSGTPTTGQSLVATGTTTAAWSGSAGVYKMESMQYTPTTFVSSAGGALFTYSLPANELALNQALRISSTGTWTNTSGVTRTYTFTLKAGSTTLYTWALTSSATSVSNLPWGITFLAICTASGSSGTLEVQALENRYSGMADPTSFLPTANTATIAFDTTSIQSITLNVAQTNDATTSTTGRQFMVERLG